MQHTNHLAKGKLFGGQRTIYTSCSERLVNVHVKMDAAECDTILEENRPGSFSGKRASKTYIQRFRGKSFLLSEQPNKSPDLDPSSNLWTYLKVHNTRYSSLI